MGATVSQITGVSTVYSLLLAINYNQRGGGCNLELTSLVKVATDVRFNIHVSPVSEFPLWISDDLMIHIHDSYSW